MLIWMDILIWSERIVDDILQKVENHIYCITKYEFLIWNVCLFP